ncbi:MAG: hypothetical protein M3362_21170, partial [Acidobacteriota bacterium]|nr:hypothetical protein [Acidobacteriota bacterium]
MGIINSSKSGARVICALAALVLFALTANVRAGSVQHDMQNMPGMNMGSKTQNKTKSKSRSTASKRKRTQRR